MSAKPVMLSEFTGKTIARYSDISDFIHLTDVPAVYCFGMDKDGICLYAERLDVPENWSVGKTLRGTLGDCLLYDPAKVLFVLNECGRIPLEERELPAKEMAERLCRLLDIKCACIEKNTAVKAA